MAKYQIKDVEIEKIKPYFNNPRHNDEAVPAVAKSIEDNGFLNPVILDKNFVIVAGHTRIKAAKRLGLKTAPCIILHDKTDDQVAAYRLIDNKTAELSGWDLEALEAELDAIDEDLSAYGFPALIEKLKELDEAEIDLPEIDPEDTSDIETMTQAGQLWKLGRHRLICGDSTDPETIARLTDGATIDLYLTDPPYNVEYKGRKKPRRSLNNDSMSDANYEAFLEDAFTAADPHIKPGGVIYIWHGDAKREKLYKALTAVDWHLSCFLIWVKNMTTVGWGDYHMKHEPCFYGWKEGGEHYFTADRTQKNVISDPFIYTAELKKKTKAQMIEIILDLQTELEAGSNILRYDKPVRSDLHPTTKPVQMIGQLIRNSSRPGENILDSFGGSGTTLIAAEQLGRTCYTAELDLIYCDTIIERYEMLTGEKAELIN